MPYCYIARSKSLQEWGNAVGISKNLYKVGITQEDVKSVVSKMNLENYAGKNDWKLVLHGSVEESKDSLIYEKIKQSIDMIDPEYYPQIRGAIGIFKVKLQNVEDSLLLGFALQNKEKPINGVKVGSKEIAKYILEKINKS